MKSETRPFPRRCGSDVSLKKTEMKSVRHNTRDGCRVFFLSLSLERRFLWPPFSSAAENLPSFIFISRFFFLVANANGL